MNLQPILALLIAITLSLVQPVALPDNGEPVAQVTPAAVEPTPEPTVEPTPIPTVEPTAESENLPFEFDVDTCAITEYTGTDTDVVIPSSVNGYPVTRLGRSLFNFNEAITSVEIPDSVTILEPFALYCNSSLSSVRIPANLEIIGSANFYYEELIESVTIPATVNVIADYCFYSCDNLREITFEGVVPYISDVYAFTYLADDAVIYVPDDQLDAYIAALPEGLNVQPSGENAVVTERISPEYLFDIDEDGTVTAYFGDETCIYVPDTINGTAVTAIGDDVFSWTSNKGLSKTYLIVIPEGVTCVGRGIGRNCGSLVNVVLPSTLTEIGDEAFVWLCGNDAVKLPDSVEIIGKNAFENANVGSYLQLPANLKVIGENAFLNAFNLYEVYFNADIETVESGAFAETNVEYLSFAAILFPPSVKTYSTRTASRT